MKIDFFDVDAFCVDLPAVTTNKIYSKKGFHPNGLFSEKIFGPVRTCTCGCGIYWGRSKIGETCSICGVEIGNSSLRRKKFGKIVLPFPVINPIMTYLITRAGKVTISKVVDAMINDDSVMGFYFNVKSKRYIKVNVPTIEDEAVELPEGVILYTGSNGIYDLIKFESERLMDTNPTWKFVNENLHKFFMKNVIICPPEFRPVSKTKDAQMRDKMNEFYMTILNFALMLENDVSTYENSEIQMINFKNLQRYVFNFYDYVFSKFSKKSGLIRGSILGKRIDFSARAVICPGPELELDQASIPYTMALELYKLKVVNRLLEIKHVGEHRFVRYDPTIDYVNTCIAMKDYSLMEIVQEITKDQLIILNRQPTLHRMGLLSFKIKINTDDVIKIHPCICEPYNADFDGDQMAAYISLYDKTLQSNYDKIFILKNLISPSTGKMILGINQDILLGLYLMTKDDASTVCDYDGSNIKIGPDGIEVDKQTTKSRITFNEVFPDDFPFINKIIDKKEINILLNEVVHRYDPEVVKLVVDKIKKLGLRETTLRGVTFSLKDLDDEGSYDVVSAIVDDPDKSIVDKFHELNDSPYKKHVQEIFPYSDFIKSGSRGSWDQANQLIFCRGYMSNSKGEVVPTPIKHNLVSGLTRDEYFISCYGSRKALLDVALNTAVSGYLTRKLVYCSANLELEEELDDCGTTDYLTLKIPRNISDEEIESMVSHIEDENEKKIQKNILLNEKNELDAIKLARSLVGRWHYDENGDLTLITDSNYLDLCGKTLKLRSPIYCKSSRICKKCYGESSKSCHSKYIGVIAAQALGEVATQLTLRTFHTGGIAVMSREQEDENQKDIISDLTVVNKLLHGTMKIDALELLKRLFTIYVQHKTLLLVHFECVISQMMRCGDSRWRLMPERHKEDHQIISIENVPSKESFLLALAFSKPHAYIVNGIIGDAITTDGILEKMLTNSI